MAYTLQSLIYILEQDYNHLTDIKPQIETLLKQTNSLKDLLENSSPLSRVDLKIFESPIRDAAHKAEDVLESYIRDRVLLRSTQVPDLKDVTETFDSILEKTLKTMEPPNISAVSSTSSVVVDSTSKSRVIGFDKDLIQLTDQLIGQRPTLEVIPLVGMGGMGKTTLARKLYIDLQKHFDIRGWVTVSQGYDMHLTLLKLLECLRTVSDKMHHETDDKLGEYVHKSLFGRRYLIVVDDIWDTQAWDQMRRYCPDNKNGSRIILTTRQSAVASYAKTESPLHYMHLLDEDSSWELLVEKVFGEKESCPLFIEKTGRKISNNCRGLPLAISVMGGLLYASEKKLEFWDLVEKNVSSTITKRDVHFQNILSLSYNYLPYHLKPCFLYVGAFPEDYEIRVSKLIKLWIAEGFLKRDPNNRMEDTAGAYLKALVDRNLLVVRRQESDGKIKRFSIHDLLRELCLKKSVEENFFWLKSSDDPQEPEIIRRVSAHSSSNPYHGIINNNQSTSFTRSLMCIGRPSLDLASMLMHFGLLRVLDVFHLEFNVFPLEILELVNLRYLAFTCYSNLPSSISRFRNLQSLIIRRLTSFRVIALPSELWEMTELRHIKSKETCSLYFPKNGKIALQDKLQTLSNIQMCGFTNEVVSKIPNIRKLGLFCNASMKSLIDLASLQKLEILRCSSDLSLNTREFLSYLTFPPFLQKLTLNFCRIPWGVMAAIGSLSHLKQLKIQHSDFQGMEWMKNEPERDPTEPEWELIGEYEFPELELLLLEDLNLAKWTSDNNCFESLKHLVIRDCCSLSEIPSAIEDSETLEKIEVDESSPSVVELVNSIKQNKEDAGNDIQVDIYSA